MEAKKLTSAKKSLGILKELNNDEGQAKSTQGGNEKKIEESPQQKRETLDKIKPAENQSTPAKRDSMPLETLDKIKPAENQSTPAKRVSMPFEKMDQAPQNASSDKSKMNNEHDNFLAFPKRKSTIISLSGIESDPSLTHVNKKSLTTPKPRTSEKIPENSTPRGSKTQNDHQRGKTSITQPFKPGETQWQRLTQAEEYYFKKRADKNPEPDRPRRNTDPAPGKDEIPTARYSRK